MKLNTVNILQVTGDTPDDVRAQATALGGRLIWGTPEKVVQHSPYRRLPDVFWVGAVQIPHPI